MTLGQRIQTIRTERGLSQEAFGQLIGTTRQAVSKWENDSALPEIEKVVRISKIFSVTTDSILIDGITTFDMEYEKSACGIYRSDAAELVETERFAVLFYCGKDMSLGARLYSGLIEKRLIAIVERDMAENVTRWAYEFSGIAFGNDNQIKSKLGDVYDSSRKERMRRRELFYVDHEKKELPRVCEVGIRNSLLAWRMGDRLSINDDYFCFTLLLGCTEYVFSIKRRKDDIYCGASYNIPLDIGMMSGGQYFRIRNFDDNKEPFCGFHCDFSYESLKKNPVVPIAECRLGKCVNTGQGLFWGLKRFDDGIIVLQGCGNEEYVYKRDGENAESFIYE